MADINILYRSGEAEIVEKKSRFLAAAMPVHSEQEAQEAVAARRKQFWDARHHCWAYVIGEEPSLKRCSDDGEPQGTAGRPILDVLTGAGMHDTLMIVTRYFGGVLLGTGGLVRAYGRAASEALASSAVVLRRDGCLLTLSTDYNGLGKIQYLLSSRNIPMMNEQYTDRVSLDILVPEEETESICAALTEATAGRTAFSGQRRQRYGMLEGKPVLFS